jgi:hypothetical protein
MEYSSCTPGGKQAADHQHQLLSACLSIAMYFAWSKFAAENLVIDSPPAGV